MITLIFLLVLVVVSLFSHYYYSRYFVPIIQSIVISFIITGASVLIFSSADLFKSIDAVESSRITDFYDIQRDTVQPSVLFSMSKDEEIRDHCSSLSAITTEEVQKFKDNHNDMYRHLGDTVTVKISSKDKNILMYLLTFNKKYLINITVEVQEMSKEYKFTGKPVELVQNSEDVIQLGDLYFSANGFAEKYTNKPYDFYIVYSDKPYTNGVINSYTIVSATPKDDK